LIVLCIAKQACRHHPRAARQLVEMMKGDLHLRGLLCPAYRPEPAEVDAQVRLAVRTFLYGIGRPA
jgi:hypothetical protein